MTTIAADANGMSADTQLTGDYMYRVQKIVRLPDGGIAGGAGHWAKAYSGLSWLADGEDGDPPSIKGACILILRPDGSLWVAEGMWPPYPLIDKVAAIGCGAAGAMVALRRGSPPADAIKEVAKIDAGTSSPVQSLYLKDKTPRRARNRGK